MTAVHDITLATNIADAPGVGPKRADAFRRIGIRCIAHLLQHLPMRYEHEHAEQTIDAAGELVGVQHQAKANVSVRGEVATIRMKQGRTARVEATLEDDTGTMQLLWFNARWLMKKLKPSLRIRVIGTATRFGDYLQMVNPNIEYLSDDEQVDTLSERMRPIYPGSEDLSSKIVEKTIDGVLEPALAQLDDHLHDAYRESRGLPTLAASYRMVHRPESQDEIDAGRRRLAFDELLMLQLAVSLKRRERLTNLHAVALKHSGAIDRRIIERFPFKLTADQRSVVDEIADDLTKTRPMNRLLQGDVGAGKTVVALYAMLMAVVSQHQAALMAPTALLAEQHFASITAMLDKSDVRIELLTSAMKPAARRVLQERLEAGEIDILIGTHALLTESVAFKNLAVAVIDEQHRFGVHQRKRLRNKSIEADDETLQEPHTLVMTATPIPRTLSLSVFGDLDISTIRSRPPGRQPIITKHVAPAQSSEVYSYLADRLNAGDQAYIVVPAIDESSMGLTDVASHLEFLSNGPLRKSKLAAMHGRLDRAEREQIMQQFREGEIDAIVATTVIEVGVDVPNATIMIVEHADRFGLAQLHQLRGRVGRGSKKSLCVLIAEPATEDGTKRLETMVETDDGFEIAERDLQIRGPGELFGAKQSGLAPFRVARIPEDLELLLLARKDASKWIDDNPALAGKRDALLRRRLLKAHGAAFGLGDVA